jgi:hypothetical protein
MEGAAEIKEDATRRMQPEPGCSCTSTLHIRGFFISFKITARRA